MKVKELIKELSKLNPQYKVLVLAEKGGADEIDRIDETELKKASSNNDLRKGSYNCLVPIGEEAEELGVLLWSKKEWK